MKWAIFHKESYNTVLSRVLRGKHFAVLYPNSEPILILLVFFV